MLELYAHDFSEFYDAELGPDGRFGYAKLPLYWSEPGRHPLLIAVDGRLAGFALVKQGSEISGDVSTWDMAEFFIVRGHRRRGIGLMAAHEVWRRFPGAWEVRVMESNVHALAFWQRAVGQFTRVAAGSTHFEKHGKPWQLFRFASVEASA